MILTTTAMNYDDHLKRHEDALARQEQQQIQSGSEKLIALKVSCEEAQEIIRSIIQPELRKLEDALVNAGKKCTLKTSKRRFVVIDAEFEIVIEIEAGDLRSQLKFEADPETKTFLILHQDPRIHRGKHRDTQIYSRITPELVAKTCGDFLKLAFPV